MSILRCLTVLMLCLFLASVTTVFSEKSADSGWSAWADIATRLYHFNAWAWASATSPSDSGWYRVWASVGSHNDYKGGSYQGVLSKSASSYGTRSVGQPDPPIFHSHFIN